MKRIAVFVDVSNIYYCCNQKFGRKIDYNKYMEFIKDTGELVKSIAYGAQLKDEATSFISALKHVGFEIKYKKPKVYYNKDNSSVKIKKKADWDVGIAIDIVDISLGIGADTIYLGTADGDLAPVVDWARRRGITVVILACGISRELRETATKAIEIPESFLETEKSSDEQI